MTFDMRLNDLNSRLTSAKSKAQVVATWHEQFNDYGATYYHKASSREPKTVPIGDNIAMAHYIIGRSQKLKYLCGQIYKYCYQQETKLLIWYELPIEGWVISMLLATLGIQFLFIGSGTNSTERNRLVGQFDKPKDPVKIAVFSAKVLATGVNMQRGCHVAIMMGLAHNINNHVQRVGRIHRYQQKHVQEIIILSLRHSYDQILEAKSNKKMVLQLLGEARTHDVIRSDDEVRQQANDELGHNPDEFKFEEFKAGLRNKDLIGQVDKLLIQSLGMSGSRLEWDDKDLFLGKGHGLRVPKQVAKVVAHNALSFIPAVAPTSEATGKCKYRGICTLPRLTPADLCLLSEQDSTAATETRASTRATPTVDTATTEGTTPMELDPETPNSAQDMMDDLDSSRAENAAPGECKYHGIYIAPLLTGLQLRLHPPPRTLESESKTTQRLVAASKPTLEMAEHLAKELDSLQRRRTTRRARKKRKRRHLLRKSRLPRVLMLMILTYPPHDPICLILMMTAKARVTRRAASSLPSPRRHNPRRHNPRLLSPRLLSPRLLNPIPKLPPSLAGLPQLLVAEVVAAAVVAAQVVAAKVQRHEVSTDHLS